ncbi:putative nuclease HARBI1 [Episyrphus balteatus]|nr:putative nuclease HARBI1 [Episyrphus balteatus]
MAKLLITLRFYALGTMLISVGDFFGVCKTTVCLVVRRVSSAIASLRKDIIKMPDSDEEMAEASYAFYNLAKFPRTIGAIDCTHVKIQSPGGDNAEHFRNRKGYFSLNVQSVSSANLKFLNIVARWPGSCHDQTIFNNSVLKMKLERKDYKKYIVVADSGYSNTPYMATPLLECTNQVEQLYNESIIRSRNVVERKYGVWKRRFPVLSLQMRIKTETVQDVIVATAVLHNIAVDFNEEIPPNELEANIPPIESFDVARIAPDNRNNVRTELLAGYFPALLQSNTSLNTS